MSSEPVIADKSPVRVELEPGDYYYCRCGLSKNQPFCDGSHKGTDFTPKKFTLESKRSLWLCQCKRTDKEPYCDGSHKKL